MLNRAGSLISSLVTALLILSLGASAGEGPKAGFDATASFWWTIHEEVQNGLEQQGSSDRAADHASGFAFRHGRLTFALESSGGELELLVRIRLEERTDIVDFYGGWKPAPPFHLLVGQMKIPSTAEVITPYEDLDFATRSRFGQLAGDYSLTRTPYISSVMAAKSYDRDLGIAIKGSWEGDRHSGDERPLARWFLMVGNGLGANRYIGGSANEEFLFTNSIGDMYYGARLEISPVSALNAGVHGSFNQHNDASLGEHGPVFDIERSTWTMDIDAVLPWMQRIYAFYGQGDMDDYFDAQRYLFDYSGYGIQTVVPTGDFLELALRFDRFVSESGRDGNEMVEDNWTGGINFSPMEHLRLQLNYTYKKATNEFESDIDDNILLLNFQFYFDTMLSGN
jgi:hypothetical protein